MMSVKSSEDMLNTSDKQWNKAIEMIVELVEVDAHAVVLVAQRYSIPDYLEEVPWSLDMCYSVNEGEDDEDVTIVSVRDRNNPRSFQAYQMMNFYDWSQMIDSVFHAVGVKGFSYARYIYQQDVDAKLVQRLGEFMKDHYGLDVKLLLEQDWEYSPATVKLYVPFTAPLPDKTWLATVENIYGEHIVLGTFSGVDRKTVLDSIVEERKCPMRCIKMYRLADDQ